MNALIGGISVIEDAEVSLKVFDAVEFVSDHSLLSNRHLETDSSIFPLLEAKVTFFVKLDVI